MVTSEPIVRSGTMDNFGHNDDSTLKLNSHNIPNERQPRTSALLLSEFSEDEQNEMAANQNFGRLSKNMLTHSKVGTFLDIKKAKRGSRRDNSRGSVDSKNIAEGLKNEPYIREQSEDEDSS